VVFGLGVNCEACGFLGGAGEMAVVEIEDSWMLWTGLTSASCVETPSSCAYVKGSYCYESFVVIVGAFLKIAH
jgi:hypothetical protein